MKIGVMGLGQIAQKAFLPVFNRLNDQAEWHYFTRNQETLHALQHRYGWDHVYHDFAAFCDQELDACFIHTPTLTHSEYIEVFLSRGVHVYVDKPIAESYEAVVRLYDAAEAADRILFAGFNRRFAPYVQHLKTVAKNHIHVQKNRISQSQPTRYALYDLMIHPVDTALYLLDEPIISVEYHVREDAGMLVQADIRFHTQHCLAQASCNMQAGVNLERIDVLGEDGYHSLENLDQYQHIEHDRKTIHAFSDWEDTLVKRGFAPMIDDFLECAAHDRPSLIVNAESVKQSHYYIEQLYNSRQSS